jgi:hypothetical protein
MKKTQKTLFWILLLAGTASVVFGICFSSAKSVESAGLIFDIAGIIQLEISGLFEHFFEKYGDDKKYKFGPPSYITRELSQIGNPDTPIRTWFRNVFYFDRRIGIWLLALGFVFQLMANWLG